jgi:hypothetical protein
MKSIVPFSENIKFNSKIAEISSISLEHELNIENNEISGNFIISGEYKTHEVSVNKEKFTYKLPFSVDATDNILKESVEFEILDFTYEIVGDDTLKIDIEFSVSALEESHEEVKERIIEEVNEIFIPEEKEDRLEPQSEELILESAESKEDEYTTLNIHIVSSNDTLESILALYKCDLNTLKSYNTIDTINIGDKIIIPSLDE